MSMKMQEIFFSGYVVSRIIMRYRRKPVQHSGFFFQNSKSLRMICTNTYIWRIISFFQKPFKLKKLVNPVYEKDFTSCCFYTWNECSVHVLPDLRLWQRQCVHGIIAGF